MPEALEADLGGLGEDAVAQAEEVSPPRIGGELPADGDAHPCRDPERGEVEARDGHGNPEGNTNCVIVAFLLLIWPE